MGIPLGRRFRALKLWFVFRSYGLEGLQRLLRNHIEYAEWLENKVKSSKDFELVIPRTMNLVCFRHIGTDGDLNSRNADLLDKINKTGKVYLTHTVVNGKFCLRMSIGRLSVTKERVMKAWELITSLACA